MRRYIEGPVRRFFPTLLQSVKVQAIDAAFRQHDLRSFADLGGVWRVHGGYTIRTLNKFDVDRAWIVDLEFDDETRKQASKFPQLELVGERFTAPAARERVGEVDAVLVFDVLLHQAAPDWDEVLAMWAPQTRCFIVANPQWTGPETIRLLDLGKEEFLRNVLADPGQHQLHHDVFQNADEPDVFGKRLWDSTAIWQWGITDEGLDEAMQKLGFRRSFRETLPSDLPQFEDRSFVYIKD